MNLLGTIKPYTVDRETNLGYILTDEQDNEYFLHRNESNFMILKPGDTVNAFLYTDKKGRVAATLYPPLVTTDKSGFATVAGINTSVGIFLNIGISKDVLLSRDDLPIDFSQWPNEGDTICCRLRTRGERLIAKMSNKEEILEHNKGVDLPLNEKTPAYVYRITADGINFVTLTYDVIFVHHTNLRKKYRIGEKAEVKIVRKNQPGDYSGTLIEQKELMIKDDKEIILEYLRAHQGVMSITENSDPAAIMRVLTMSKNAFKKALGGLYKEKKIEILEDKIVLME